MSRTSGITGRIIDIIPLETADFNKLTDLYIFERLRHTGPEL